MVGHRGQGRVFLLTLLRLLFYRVYKIIMYICPYARPDKRKGVLYTSKYSGGCTCIDILRIFRIYSSSIQVKHSIDSVSGWSSYTNILVPGTRHLKRLPATVSVVLQCHWCSRAVAQNASIVDRGAKGCQAMSLLCKKNVAVLMLGEVASSGWVPSFSAYVQHCVSVWSSR